MKVIILSNPVYDTGSYCVEEYIVGSDIQDCFLCPDNITLEFLQNEYEKTFVTRCGGNQYGKYVTKPQASIPFVTFLMSLPYMTKIDWEEKYE